MAFLFWQSYVYHFKFTFGVVQALSSLLSHCCQRRAAVSGATFASLPRQTLTCCHSDPSHFLPRDQICRLETTLLLFWTLGLDFWTSYSLCAAPKLSWWPRLYSAKKWANLRQPDAFCMHVHDCTTSWFQETLSSEQNHYLFFGRLVLALQCCAEVE